jgi:hypothetical protein
MNIQDEFLNIFCVYSEKWIEMQATAPHAPWVAICGKM